MYAKTHDEGGTELGRLPLDLLRRLQILLTGICQALQGFRFLFAWCSE